MNGYFKKRQWLLYTILAALSWGFWGILTKFISSEISPFTTHFMFTTGMLFSLPIITRKFKVKEVNRKGIIWGIGAGIIAVCGNISVYQSFSMGGQAAVVIPLTNLYPLITIIIALLIFKEKLHWKDIIGILIVIPAIIILSGQSQLFSEPGPFFQNIGLKSWLLFAFLSLFLFGLFSASQKITTNFISAEWSYVSFIVSSLLVSIGLIAFGLVDFNFSQNTFWIGSLAGALDGLGVLFIYSAYRAYGKATQVSSIAAAMQQVFTIFLAFILLKERLDLIALIGIALAICGTLLLSVEKRNGVMD
jgi:drug/metabolite transporter (DMT)-like permease